MDLQKTLKKLEAVALPVLMLVLVLGLPGPASSPPAVAEESADGEAVFTAQKCNMCHTVSSAGIKAKTTSEKMAGPDLTGIMSKHEAEWVAKYLKKEVEGEKGAHKLAFKGTDEELKIIIDWLAEQK